NDRPTRFGAYREADQARRRCGSGAARRPARSALDVPWIAGAAAEPDVAVRKLAGRELGDEHRAGIAESLNGCRIARRHLILVRLGAPRRTNALCSKEILDAVRHAVKRSPVMAAVDLAVSLRGPSSRKIFRQR